MGIADARHNERLTSRRIEVKRSQFVREGGGIYIEEVVKLKEFTRREDAY